jgi:hypothetical protein
MKNHNSIVNICQNLQKRYRLVAYNNRLYPDWRFVNNEVYTMIGIKSWLCKYGRRDKYIYDIYDVRTGELRYNYEQMILEYLRIKAMFGNPKSLNPVQYQESLREYIFCFKRKWERRFGQSIAKFYFEELMILHNNCFEKFNQEMEEFISNKSNIA